MRTLRIAFFILIALLLLSAGVSAYSINIDAPHSVQKGDPVIVNGSSNLPAGITVPIQFSRSEYTLEIIETKQVVIQGDKNFTVSFDTTKLRGPVQGRDPADRELQLPLRFEHAPGRADS